MVATIPLAANAFASDGMKIVDSAGSVATTADKLEKILGEKVMQAFARIDHVAGAASVDRELPATSCSF